MPTHQPLLNAVHVTHTHSRRRQEPQALLPSRLLQLPRWAPRCRGRKRRWWPVRKKGERGGGKGGRGEGKRGKKGGEKKEKAACNLKIFQGAAPPYPPPGTWGAAPPQTPPYGFTTRRDSLLNPLFSSLPFPLFPLPFLLSFSSRATTAACARGSVGPSGATATA